MKVLSANRMERLPQQFFAALTKQAANLAAKGYDVINLGQGNPDLPTPPHVVEALRTAALDPATHRYSSFRGLPALREAICSYYRREYGVILDPEREVAVLFGGKAGLVEISQCLLEPGDLALVPDPGYPDYLSGIALAGAEYRMLPLLAENHFLPDYDGVAQAVSERAKLLFINYPNNPTAAVADEEFFRRTVEYAMANEIVVAHDFAYGAIGFNGQPRSFLQTRGAKEVGVEFYTLSKTYNMAGWRVAFALGNPQVIELLNVLQDHCYVSLFGAVQKAAIAALTLDQNCVKELVHIYRQRRDVFLGTLQSRGYPILPALGSFFVWIQVPLGMSSAEFATRLMEEAHVVVAPGIGFGMHGEGYARVAMLAPEERLEEAAVRMALLAPHRPFAQ